MKTFTLYRFFDADDQLLYVGLTVNPGRRMEKHRGTQPWWADVARIEMEQHLDLETLRAAEREAIKAERPLHNIRMNGRQQTSSAPPLVWICEVCRTAVPDDAGYIAVSYADLLAYWEAEIRRVDQHRKTFGEPVGLQRRATEFADKVPWLVTHTACTPTELGHFRIDVAGLRKPEDAIAWTAEILTEKTWLHITDWGRILDLIAGQMESE